MKKISLLTLLTFISFSLFANPIGKKEKQLNAGVGFSSWGVPLYVGLDYGVHQDVSIGGELSFRTYSDNWDHKTYTHTIIGLSGNGNYHFNRLLEIPKEWDLYAGLNLGFVMWNSPNDYHGTHTSGLSLNLQVGGRYYFNEKFGLNLEFGGGTLSGGKFGISYKF